MDSEPLGPAERDSNAIIEERLDERMRAVEQAVGADCLTYFGPIAPGASDEIKDAVEAMRIGDRPRRES